MQGQFSSAVMEHPYEMYMSVPFWSYVEHISAYLKTILLGTI